MRSKFTIKLDDVLQRALDLSSRPDDNFPELARCLATLHDHAFPTWKRFLEASGMGRRKAYYLVEIGNIFERLQVPEARLRKIGWTKAQIIGRHITRANANRRLKQAEENTAPQLEALMRDENAQMATRCVKMYFTAEEYVEFEQAILRHGGTQSGRGLRDKEKATLNMIRKAHGAPDMEKPGPKRARRDRGLRLQGRARTPVMN